MHQSIAPLVEIYKTNTLLFTHALGDVAGEDVIKRPDPTMNSMHFVAGHMLNSRFVIGKLAGLEDECPWPGIFARGAKVKDISEYPDISEIKAAWNAYSQKMISKLSDLSDTQLQAGVSANYPVDDKTVLGAIAFLALHESYHVGQLAMLRKRLKYSPLAD